MAQLGRSVGNAATDDPPARRAPSTYAVGDPRHRQIGCRKAEKAQMHENPWIRRFQPGTEIATRQGRLA